MHKMAARRLVKETWNSLEAKESLGTEYSVRVKGRDKEDKEGVGSEEGG